MSYRVVLIDFDGTLADTRRSVVACMRRTLAERGFDMPDGEKIQEVIAAGLSLDQAVAVLVPQLTPDEISRCVETYRDNYPAIDAEHTQLFEGARETLAALEEAGMAVVILSNKGVRAIEATLARFETEVSAVIAAEPGAPMKPDPAVFHERVAPLFGVRPAGDYLMVGDTRADLAFANAVGIAACFARYGYGEASDCLGLSPDHVINTLGELAAIVCGPPAVTEEV
ncbi:phosphoglycolate phosphatase [Rhodopseudomonas julia]|uniref:phosphoglycolate phosphatase n=1 Tax=Rhodopseudomonas julia TaxID=200617 RepID=A0ABU0C3C1_9BRAD|nr:HAD family hydrolase [Rhodopseudomonas julia]MDQ0325017.1 phosphoglycolate phosphatase [Rhodopseudomonas julia]